MYHFQDDQRPADPVASSTWEHICTFLAWEWESRLRLYDTMLTNPGFSPNGLPRASTAKDRLACLNVLIEEVTRERDGFLDRAARARLAYDLTPAVDATDAARKLNYEVALDHPATKNVAWAFRYALTNETRRFAMAQIAVAALLGAGFLSARAEGVSPQGADDAGGAVPGGSAISHLPG